MAKKELIEVIKQGNLKEYKNSILNTYNKIYDSYFDSLADIFFIKGQSNFVVEEVEKISTNKKIEFYSAQLLLVLVCTIKLNKIYKVKGYSDDVLNGLLTDIKAKIEECIYKYNIIGTDSASWFALYYYLDLFTLGRLGYELNFNHEYSYTFNNKTYSNDELAISIHIPSGKNFEREYIISSLKQAYSFFKDKIIDGILPCVCQSWLLYKPYEKIFDKGNLKNFREMFDIIGNGIHEQFYNGWRVFGTTDFSDTSKLPQNTSLQKKFVKWLDDGNENGYGFGVLLFDGENILTEKN